MADDIAKKKDTNARLQDLERAVSQLRAVTAELGAKLTSGFQELDLCLTTEMRQLMERLAKIEEQIKARTPPP